MLELQDLDVPVYAHPLEHPYLDGTASYPPPILGRRRPLALLWPLFRVVPSISIPGLKAAA
ncbi:hypothetical protein [Mesorhizobium sp. WSM4976]|uniref:hypothetical protein n=1 Tax=Mesorhizobium sp. WSM4976 TaxID=3038549 RepID=UPI003241C677